MDTSTFVWGKKQYNKDTKTVVDILYTHLLFTQIHTHLLKVTVDVTDCNVTFEAAVSANKEEADFIPFSITHWFRWTSRTSGGYRVAVGKLLNGDPHLWQRCRGHA